MEKLIIKDGIGWKKHPTKPNYLTNAIDGDYVAEIARLRAECARLEDHINDADDENIRLRADNALLQEQLREWRGHATADELARLRAEVERLRAYIESTQSADCDCALCETARAALAADGKGE